MLSRVASNLYWMGRNIERAEHLARYTKEIYFSSLDAPIEASSNRQFVLESMLYMAGIFDMENITEEEVLYKIGLDTENPNSILSTLTYGRENARGVRNAISSQLWEAINKAYHIVNSYSPETFVVTGLYDFTQTTIEQSSIVRGKINGTLLHDETWAIMLLGIHVERAFQIIRIINSKLNDIYKIEQSGIEVTQLSFEWSTLLRCTDSFDMNRKYYRTIPNKDQVMEFLILNIQCPRSIAHCLQSIQYYIRRLSADSELNKESIDFKIGKLCSGYKYLTIDEIKDDIYGILNYTQNRLMKISVEFEKTYLDY